MSDENLKHKTIRSIVSLVGRTAFLRVVSMLALIPLGIYLSPSTFGIFFSLTALSQIFSIFTDLGLGAAIIQKKDPVDDHDLRTVFTIQEILVVSVVVVGFLLTNVVVQITKITPDGVFLYWSLLLVMFISSLKAIPSVLLEKKLQFEKQIIPQIVESLVFNGILVYLAYRGLEVRAYSWAFLISALSGLPIYYYLSPWKLALGISPDRAKKLVSFGLQYQAKGVLSIFKDNLLTLFLNSWVGSAGIGYWGWWQKWAYSPYGLIVDSVTRVTFPAYSQIQENLVQLKSGIEKSLFTVSSVIFPILSLIAVLMDRVLILFPKYEKWTPGLGIFYFLCLAAAVSSLSNILINALDATGRVKTTLKLMVFWTALTWVLTIICVSTAGFTGIGIASFLVSLSIVITVVLVKRIVEFSFLPNILPALISSIFMIVVVVVGKVIFPSNFVSLFALGFAGAIIYLITMLLLARNKAMEVLRIVLGAYFR